MIHNNKWAIQSYSPYQMSPSCLAFSFTSPAPSLLLFSTFSIPVEGGVCVCVCVCVCECVYMPMHNVLLWGGGGGLPM